MIASPRTFRCLNCNEMINDSMTQCRYCNVPVDAVVARLVAERQERANQSYSDASFLRTAAIVIYVCVVLSFTPIVAFVGSVGFVITFFLVLALLIRWQLKFGRLVTNDADYLKARRSWRFALMLWILAIPIGLIVRSSLSLLA